MATVTSTDPGLTASYPNVKQVKWVLTGADTGTGVVFANFPDRTITVTGTWDSATLVVAGSNDGTNYVTLTDPQGNAISKTADFIEALLENPLYVRVSTSGGGASTSLTAIITGRTNY